MLPLTLLHLCLGAILGSGYRVGVLALASLAVIVECALIGCMLPLSFETVFGLAIGLKLAVDLGYVTTSLGLLPAQGPFGPIS
jgi:hypothetical protein